MATTVFPNSGHRSRIWIFLELWHAIAHTPFLNTWLALEYVHNVLVVVFLVFTTDKPAVSDHPFWWAHICYRQVVSYC